MTIYALFWKTTFIIAGQLTNNTRKAFEKKITQEKIHYHTPTLQENCFALEKLTLTNFWKSTKSLSH